MGQPLTSKQRKLLNQLQTIQAKLGYRPSYRELAKAVGLSSPATVHTHLKTLEQKGYVRKDSEGMFVPIQQVSHASIEIPVKGMICANAPLEKIDEYQIITIPAQMIADAEGYVLIVKDDSLQSEYLLKNDQVIVEQKTQVKNGDLIVGRLENDTLVVRKYYREATSIRLQPQDPLLPPTFVQKVTIEGIIKGVLRKFE